jgi:hypothetical protein
MSQFPALPYSSESSWMQDYLQDSAMLGISLIIFKSGIVLAKRSVVEPDDFCPDPDPHLE